MSKLIRALVGALWLVGAAHADMISSSDPAKVPHSIWDVATDGTVTHRQSELVCPVSVNGFQRNKMTLYDAVGLDVSCGYNSSRGWVTVYLTRLGPMNLAAAFDDAKRQLLQNSPAAQVLPDADQKTFAGAETYLHLIYIQKNGAERTGIWMTEFSGWMFEFRATYEPGAEAEIFDEMAEIARRAVANAGTHLALCAKSDVPLRGGSPLTDEKDRAAVGLAAGAVLLADTLPETQDRPKPEQPEVWCAERMVTGFKIPILLWHAVTADGKTQNFDRVSVSTYGDSPMLVSSAGRAGLVFDEIKNDSTTHFVVTLQNGDDLLVFGAWSGRPSGDDLGRLIQDFFDHTAKPLAAVNIKTKTITMFQAPK